MAQTPLSPLRGNRSAFAVAKHRMGADGYSQRAVEALSPRPAQHAAAGASGPAGDVSPGGAGDAPPAGDGAAGGGGAHGTLTWHHYKDADRRYVYQGGITKVRDVGDANAKPTPATHVRHHTGDPPATFTYPNGDVYEGPWRMGKMHGAKGILRLANGYRYEGGFDSDLPHGKGGEIFTHNEYLMCNHYERGLPQKTGTLFYAPRETPGFHYQGGFKNGRRHGKGVIHYPNGDVFKGTWDEGKRAGEGVTYYARNKRKFKTVWKGDKLVSGPTEVVGPHELDNLDVSAIANASVGASVGYAPADLTKWKVQDGVTDLSVEHFHRLNAGFEKLDTEFSGELPIQVLTRLWGTKDPKLLKRLDRNKDGRVSMEEVLLQWYPSVRRSQLMRFVDIEPSIPNIWRLRGKLAGATHEKRDGFYCVAKEGVLRREVLKEKGNALGGEAISQVVWGRAVGLNDPPGFVDILEAWYPNTPRYVLDRFDMQRVPAEELETCHAAFAALDSEGTGYLDFDTLVAAREIKRTELSGRAAPAVAAPIAALANALTTYFFKSEPCWVIGAHIRLTVPMAQQVLDWNKAAGRAAGKLKPTLFTFEELLRYAFPALPCVLMKDALMGRPRRADAACTCDVCGFCEGLAAGAVGFDGF